MTIGDLALGGGGIAVTLATFWLGIRRTLGVKHERVRRVDAEVEATVLKRILLDQMKPSVEDLERLVQGKAIAASLDAKDLRPIQGLASVLWTRVVENDLIPADRRTAILQSIFPIERVAKEIAPAPVGDLERSRDSLWRPEQAVVLIALVSALLGTVVAAIGVQDESGGPLKVLAFFGIALITVAIPAIIVTYRTGASEGVIGIVRSLSS